MQALQSSFAGMRVAVKARAAKTSVNTAVVARRTKAPGAASSSQWYGEDRPKVRPQVLSGAVARTDHSLRLRCSSGWAPSAATRRPT
jgi:hypothetical protein